MRFALSFTLAAAVTSTALAGPATKPGAGVAPSEHAPAGAPPSGQPQLDPRMPAVFLAVGKNDPAAVRAALSSGVSPDCRNFIGLTPLIFAASTGHQEAAEALLKAGAAVNAESPVGSALTIAEAEGQGGMARFLLARGADAEAKRVDQISPLMMAAAAGHTDVVKDLLEKGAKPDRRNNDGATALIYAARFGQTEVARALLGKGATVEAADHRAWTPLMYAAANGHTATAALLLQKGAKSDARDNAGRTPLLITASYSGDTALARLLLTHGANAKAADKKGRTPATMAAIRQNRGLTALLREHGAVVPVALIGRPASPRAAAVAGLKLIEHSATIFDKKLGCVSCHHQTMELLTTATAKEYGLAIDAALEKAQFDRMIEQGKQMAPGYLQAEAHPPVADQIPFAEIGEAVTGESFTLTTLAANHVPGNDGLAATAIVLGRRQSDDGAWRFHLQRVPLQSSDFTTTAMAVRVMKSYAAGKYADEVSRRTEKARQWMLTAKAAATEDRTYRLLGLKWSGAGSADLKQAADDLRATQQADGGWSQLPGMKSDAYATGEALVALKLAGGATSNEATVRKGIDFLLRTQDDDGSWYVHKRAAPLNFFTDVEFPHGESQYASFDGACWATMALIMTSGDKPNRQKVTLAPRH